ncbi:hypothetical protein EP331_06280 [bacterium]|nr:MAG: hypothetical protein EP331_06280 [bacterium]
MNSLKKISSIVSILILGLVFYQSTEAQTRYQSAKTMAFGGGGIAYLGDYEALFTNPANIFHRRKNTFMTIGGLVNLNLQAGGPLVNINAYNNYFTTGNRITLNQLDDEVIPTFFGDDDYRSIGVNLDVIPLGFSYGNDSWAIAMATRARVITDSQVNGGLMALMGGFNEQLFGMGRDVNFRQDAVGFAEVSAGFAMPVFSMEMDNGLHRLTVGVAPKMLLGIHYSSIKFNSTLKVIDGVEIRHNIDYSISTVGGAAEGIERFINDRAAIDTLKFVDLFDGDYLDNASDNIASPTNGTGFGLDLGLTYEWYPSFNKDMKLTGAFSITDIGSIDFKTNAGTYAAAGEFLYSGFNYNSDRIKNEFNRKFGDYLEYVISDSLAENSYGNIQKTGSGFSYNLPTMMNFGFMLNWKSLTVMTDFGKNFYTGGLSSSSLYMSTGLEYRVFSFWPIRLGTRFGGASSAAYSFGTGLEFKNYEFTLGAILTPKTESGLMLGLGLSTFTLRF